jgi:hypothetical protein
MNINILWKGPYKLEKVKNIEENWNEDYGLYQITLKEPKKSEKLLYIGLTNDQIFSIRIGQHVRGEKFKKYKYDCLQFYIGKIIGTKQGSNDEWRKMIEQAEMLMIFANKPKENLEYKKSNRVPSDKSLENIHVLNWGVDDKKYGPILPEASGERWTWKNYKEDFKVFKIDTKEK